MDQTRVFDLDNVQGRTQVYYPTQMPRRSQFLPRKLALLLPLVVALFLTQTRMAILALVVTSLYQCGLMPSVL
ncbi:hypothetical protein PN462_01085 [Spirulina sp. CS-785/01]|nr:hypothetical protein [Spirulina sp. CS-785/01]